MESCWLVESVGAGARGEPIHRRPNPQWDSLLREIRTALRTAFPRGDGSKTDKPRSCMDSYLESAIADIKYAKNQGWWQRATEHIYRS